MFACRSILNSFQKNAKSFLGQINNTMFKEFNQSSISILKLNQSTLLNKNQNLFLNLSRNIQTSGIIEAPMKLFNIDTNKFSPILINKISDFQNSRMISRNKLIFSELKWRRRKMNKKKRTKYVKKMFFVLQRRNQSKEKRYQAILNLFEKIQQKKVQVFDIHKFVNRELEKAKFFGYQSTPIYDQYRDLINQNLKTFDEKYFRKFANPSKPIHLVYESEKNQIPVRAIPNLDKN